MKVSLHHHHNVYALLIYWSFQPFNGIYSVNGKLEFSYSILKKNRLTRQLLYIPPQPKKKMFVACD